MSTTFRLDSNFPAVAASFRTAPPERRREAVVAAVGVAVHRAGLEGDVVREALDHLQEGRAVTSAELRERVERLLSNLDDSYLDAYDDGDQGLAISSFSKARAAAALSYALTADDDAWHEAIYEATMAVEEPGDVMEVVTRLLG